MRGHKGIFALLVIALLLVGSEVRADDEAGPHQPAGFRCGRPHPVLSLSFAAPFEKELHLGEPRLRPEYIGDGGVGIGGKCGQGAWMLLWEIELGMNTQPQFQLILTIAGLRALSPSWALGLGDGLIVALSGEKPGFGGNVAGPTLRVKPTKRTSVSVIVGHLLHPDHHGHPGHGIGMLLSAPIPDPTH